MFSVEVEVASPIPFRLQDEGGRPISLGRGGGCDDVGVTPQVWHPTSAVHTHAEVCLVQ